MQDLLPLKTFKILIKYPTHLGVDFFLLELFFAQTQLQTSCISTNVTVFELRL